MSDFPTFILAVKKGDYEDVKRKFKPEYKNMTDSEGCAALHHASCTTNEKIVCFLVDQGCNIESENNNKDRPIHCAVMKKSETISKSLINYGCLLDRPNKSGQTPLDLVKENKEAKLICIIQEAMKTFRVSEDGFDRGELLGRGKLGNLYKCTDCQTKTIFLLREVLLPINVIERKNIKMLQDAINTYSKLKDHARLVKYYGTTANDNQMNIFLEHVPMGSLRQYLNFKGTCSQNLVEIYLRQILEGLDFLHNNKIFHGDVRASSIMLVSNEKVKLRNFGIRKFIPISTMMSPKGTTKNYADIHNWSPPEVLKGDGYNFLSDVWSLGVTAVELLSGQPIYPGLKFMDLVSKLMGASKIEYKVPESISQDLKSLMDDMLEKDKEKRATVKMLLQNSLIRCV